MFYKTLKIDKRAMGEAPTRHIWNHSVHGIDNYSLCLHHPIMAAGLFLQGEQYTTTPYNG